MDLDVTDLGPAGSFGDEPDEVEDGIWSIAFFNVLSARLNECDHVMHP